MKKEVNQNGETPSDKPGDTLVNPPDKNKKQVSSSKGKPSKGSGNLQIRNVTR